MSLELNMMLGDGACPREGHWGNGLKVTSLLPSVSLSAVLSPSLSPSVPVFPCFLLPFCELFLPCHASPPCCSALEPAHYALKPHPRAVSHNKFSLELWASGIMSQVTITHRYSLCMFFAISLFSRMSILRLSRHSLLSFCCLVFSSWSCTIRSCSRPKDWLEKTKEPERSLGISPSTIYSI